MSYQHNKSTWNASKQKVKKINLNIYLQSKIVTPVHGIQTIIQSSLNMKVSTEYSDLKL